MENIRQYSKSAKERVNRTSVGKVTELHKDEEAEKRGNRMKVEGWGEKTQKGGELVQLSWRRFRRSTRLKSVQTPTKPSSENPQLKQS
jgi:hypothetical protein